jgi:low temperature requirement protein LtrA
MVDLDSDFGHDGRNRAHSDIPWIELFIDLVFIAALIQAGDRLIDHLDIIGLAEFTAVFALLWWVWSSIAIHFARRETDDVAARLIVFVFVFAVACVGVMGGRGLAEHAQGFALFYALARLVLAALYADLAWRHPGPNPLAIRFALGFGSGAVLWAASAFVPDPWRYGVWLLAIATELATGLLQDKRELRTYLALDAGRLSERYGQLTLIVLGESFIKITSGLVNGAGLTLQSGALTLFALVFIGALFWSYYGDIAGSTIQEGRARLWTYLHLPLTMSIAALAVSFDPIVEREAGTAIDIAHHRMLHFCAAAAFFWLAMIDIFARTSDAVGGYGAGLARLASAVLLCVSWMVGAGTQAVFAVGLAALACALPVIVESLRRPHVDPASRAEVKKEREPPPSAQTPLRGKNH